MEQLQVISDAKSGKFPAELEKNLPEITKILKKMLAIDPNERPSLENILQHLKLPAEMDIELSGDIIFKREDSDAWDNKYFKLVGKDLYVFNNKKAKKAESVYSLAEWSVLLEDSEKIFDQDENSKNSSMVSITLEDPMKLGCTFRVESYEQTIIMFNQLSKHII